MGPDVTIRTARDDDPLDEVMAGCVTWVSEAFIRRVMAATPAGARGLWVAEVDGQVAGCATAVGVGIADGHRGRSHLYVRPQFRGRGVGTQLWEHVLSICTPDRVAGIMLSVDADDSTSRQIALSHGLAPAQRHVLSTLDLTGFAASPALQRDDGIVIRTLDDDLGDAGWQSFARLFSRLLLETPDQSSGAEPLPYAVMRAALVEPWQVMGAWDGDTMVGFTSLFIANQATGRLETMMTGVERPYRRRGLATAMKTAHAVAMRDAGWRSIGTLNVETNVPILASNRTLGFRRVATLQEVVLDYRVSVET